MLLVGQLTENLLKYEKLSLRLSIGGANDGHSAFNRLLLLWLFVVTGSRDTTGSSGLFLGHLGHLEGQRTRRGQIKRRR